MRIFTTVIGKCSDTGSYLDLVSGFTRAHSHGAMLDELNGNFRKVIVMPPEDGEPKPDGEFAGTHDVVAALGCLFIIFLPIVAKSHFITNHTNDTMAPSPVHVQKTS